VRLDARLFGESPSRIVLSASPEKADRIQQMAAERDVPVHVLGKAGGDTLTIEADDEVRVSESVADMDAIWRGAIPTLMSQ
jgi:phosphoribosylformylglycinamidine synthase